MAARSDAYWTGHDHPCAPYEGDAFADIFISSFVSIIETSNLLGEIQIYWINHLYAESAGVHPMNGKSPTKLHQAMRWQ